MRAVFVIGCVLLILGVASLFVPVRVRERHGIEAGDVSIGIETVEREKVHPGVSAVLIAGGVVLIAVGARKKR